ncbi:MAG: hypothetical protein PHH36_05180 [Sideroxydans sp.]|nr:hypothetical protein [Sideroxydans sp.]
MIFKPSPQARLLAQNPHNIFILGLFAFDLFMTPAVLAMKLGMISLLIPLLFSGSLMAYINWRSKQDAVWFVQMHWRLAWTRCRILLIGYAISATLILFAWLLSNISSDPHMASIIWTALTRIALMPTLVIVLVTSVMAFNGYAMAQKGELPDKLVAKFPPPETGQA